MLAITPGAAEAISGILSASELRLRDQIRSALDAWPSGAAEPSRKPSRTAKPAWRAALDSPERVGSRGSPKGGLTDLADLRDQIGQAADLSPRPGVEREGVSEGGERMVLLGRRGADSGVAAMGGPGIGVRCS